MMFDGESWRTLHSKSSFPNMKKNKLNNNEDQFKNSHLIGMNTIINENLYSSRKKLKFGVDTILGSQNESLFETNNDSDNNLKHKVSNNFVSPNSRSSSSTSNDHCCIESSSLKQQFEINLNKNSTNQIINNLSQNTIDDQQLNNFAQIRAINQSDYSLLSTNSLWRSNLSPFIGNYFGNNVSSSVLNGSISSNGLYFPSVASNLFWPLGFRNKIRPRMLKRAVFSDQQRKGLEIAFLKQKYITKVERKKLAQRLDLKDSQVKIWFQNRRMKWRNTKDHNLLTSTNSIDNDKNDLSNDSCDCQDKQEIVTFIHSPIQNNNNETNYSKNNENEHLRTK